MLVNIHVKNMALIKEADIHLGNGLNILSGETGAGKSIMMGAVSVALGLQGFKGFAREDAEYALSELVFVLENEELVSQVRALDIPVEDGEVIVTRRLMNGRSISKINGETVPIATVKKISGLLLDIHGQHENQTLLHIKKHLEVLDGYAGEALSEEMNRYRTQFLAYQNLKTQLSEAVTDAAERNKEIDFLQYEIQEIEGASLRKGEDAELELDFAKMSNARKLQEAAYAAISLTGADGAADAVGRAARELNDVTKYDKELQELSNQLAEIDDLLGGFNRDLSDYCESLEFDEADFAEKEERLDLINHLKSKYGNTIEEILQYQSEKETRMEKLQNYEEWLLNLNKNYEDCRKKLEKQAERISDIRITAAKEFASRIKDALLDLNFLEVRFEVLFNKTEGFTPSGKDEVCFMISTNPGQPLKPVQDTASGGELSRIMLAVKTVMADKDAVETLIFDEIDSGISGRTAQKVSEKLAQIAKTHQIICITHLAQIAAMADAHFIIEKGIHDGMTETKIRCLDEAESIEELARILGGSEITETVMENAKEMKQLSKRLKLPV